MGLDWTSIRAVVLDMDGVLWRGSQTLPGVRPFFEFVTAQGIPFALATNNSTKTVATYVERLHGVGVPAAPEQIITSAVATSDYMRQHYDPEQTPLYIIGQDGLRQGLSAHGFREDPAEAKAVVVGLDFEINFEKLRTATLCIRAGADFIGTNGDRTFPVPEGLVPGAGSLLAALQAATDVTPTVIGKPERAMFDVAVARFGVPAANTLMIGDRLETDILGGQRAGLQTAVVLTGITTPEMARTHEIQANATFDSLAALHDDWTAALR